MKKLILIFLFFSNLFAIEDTKFIACEKGDAQACYEVGLLLYMGQSTAKDDEGAVLFFKKACDKKHDNACVAYAQMLENGLGIKADKNAALNLYENGCKQKNVLSCKGAERLHSASNKNKKRLSEIRAFLCKNGEDEYCENALVTLENTKAVARLDNDCKNGNKDSCETLVNLYFKAQGTPENIQSAIFYTDRLCKLDVATSCRNLAIIFQGQSDIEGAKNYYARACAMGDKISCSEYKKLSK
ncbi:sel1 repeat family protein [Campylobacter sp. VBCF_06 NA8]|uniref:tetratricopeptide repeat protein n=1 Tax=unclassified Campylobacter TaxID=2593542 RepID=UPI0022E9BB18|nr:MULTISPECIES: tetratricopeptide repeat protein [unclassified Campylobacter]MDA3046863.1 sel1 repeat family protein [Campylobacter sp. VBCF_06 NA8]MDA3048476.1 sel1 repeat family protein [Campylobacter sp. JMF_08 NE1]MDA3050274.1 sel1 repeat family protein [Campylobacter sp. JMF_15 NE4]MDA3051705.1 sel1 repeat family protein [Campylobacter sp. JMF_02 ED1]MDA3054382.1 sel1 repeat family protein [Campylobacter sp. VBCF_07 NA4]